MSPDVSPSGTFNINHGAVAYFAAISQVTAASNQTDWTLTLVLRDKPDVATTVVINVWWQTGGACSGGVVPGHAFASGSVTVPVAVDSRGVALTVPKTNGTVGHAFGSGDRLCLSISNTGASVPNDIHIYADTASTSGTPGLSRLEGAFAFKPSLNLQRNGTAMSAAITPSGSFSINHLQTAYLADANTVTSVSNAADWTLSLVLKNKPNELTPINIEIWWQSGANCAGGAVLGQTLAGGADIVPVAVDARGVAFTVPHTSGPASRVFTGSDKLCLSIENTGGIGANDIHIYADTTSTSGVSGFSRLEGPFTQ